MFYCEDQCSRGLREEGNEGEGGEGVNRREEERRRMRWRGAERRRRGEEEDWGRRSRKKNQGILIYFKYFS